MPPLGSQSKAEALLGPQRPSTGNQHREEVLDRDYRRWRVGALHRVSRTGAVLSTMRIEFDEWPKERRRFTCRPIGQAMWSTPTVKSAVPHGEACNFAVSGGARYLLEAAE